MFTNIPKQLKDWIKWLGWQKLEISHPKMRQFLEVEKIEGDLLIIKMKKVSILKVKPVNFTLKNNQEKEIIIKTFERFLNGLDFPIQIVIVTDTLKKEKLFKIT